MSEPAPGVDWKLVVSVLAIIISISTFIFNIYYNVFRGPRLRVAFGDIFTLGYLSNKCLVFHRPITFFNDGARYAAVISIRGELSHSKVTNLQSKFRWRSFIESTNVGEKGKEFKPFWSFKSWVSTIIISGHSAENENIGFISEAPLELLPGRYAVSYKFYGHDGILSSAHETFTVTEQECAFLHEKCTADEGGVRENTLVLTKDLM
jgi:hypothetical protein